MEIKSMDPYGCSLLDYFHGDESAKVAVLRDDGFVSSLPAGVFFRKEENFSPLEKKAVDLCRGKVLDIGAGAGCHSLALQKRGMKVLAIDISPQAVEILSARGVAESRRINLYDLHEGRFDTLLMMLHGIGMAETLPGLDQFLLHARALTAPGGQLIFDSLDVRRTEDPRHLAYQEANRKAGRYFGEIRMQFEYKGQKGPLFGWLHVDPETLAEHAGKGGWRSQTVYQQEDGNYLAQLTL